MSALDHGSPDHGSEHAARPRQVFTDPTGRRRRFARAAVRVLGVCLFVAAIVVGSQLDKVPTLGGPDRAQRDVTAEDVGYTPLIGQGPMLRVLELVRDGDTVLGIDPFTYAELTRLSRNDAKAAGDAQYAIQRFGYDSNSPATLSLTFDDGPDPVWTPKLLDLLSANGVRATFFVVGEHAVAHPEIVQRMVREGHAVANHSMTHPDVNEVMEWRTRLEVTLTDRVIRSLTGQRADYFRIPFGGADDESTEYSLPGILRAQKLGYAVAGMDEDPKDWEYAITEGSGAIPTPALDGTSRTVLLHDAGAGGRQKTLDYVQALIEEGRSQGYTFTTMVQAQPALADAVGPVDPTVWDDLTVWGASALLVAPKHLLMGLFVLGVMTVLVYGAVIMILARRRKRNLERSALPRQSDVPVSVVVAAYNEEPVIGRTLDALLASEHRVREIIVVDDGSCDGTAFVVEMASARDDRVRLIRQANAGKAAALDRGLMEADCEVVVTMDADTLVTPATVGNLARHFALDRTGRLGAVAGSVRVGNRTKSLLTRWQGLEYMLQIAVERAAQDHLGAIMTVPGACAAWRKQAILDAGGHSTDTLAEDTDLTLTLQRIGYQVTQDNEAIAYTEVPESVDDLLAQRGRWTFGTMQAVFKHRAMILRPQFGWLGCFTLPWFVLTIVLPFLFLPFVLVWTGVTLVESGPAPILLALALFTLIQFVIASFAVWISGESRDHLLMVPLYRLATEPLRAYLLYTCVRKAVHGGRQGWDKLIRTGTLDEDVSRRSAAGQGVAPATVAGGRP